MAIFKEICEMRRRRWTRFDAGTVMVERITADADSEGAPVKVIGQLENARIPIQIDLGSVSLWFLTRISQRTRLLPPCRR